MKWFRFEPIFNSDLSHQSQQINNVGVLNHSNISRLIILCSSKPFQSPAALIEVAVVALFCITKPRKKARSSLNTSKENSKGFIHCSLDVFQASSVFNAFCNLS